MVDYLSLPIDCHPSPRPSPRASSSWGPEYYHLEYYHLGPT